MAYYETDFYNTMRGYVIPQEPTMFEALQSIDRRTMEDINRMYNIGGNRDWMMNTVANCTFEAILENLAVKFRTGAVNRETKMNFYNLFGIVASNRVSEMAEKDGNINVSFIPGSRAIALINADKRPEVPIGIDAQEKFMIVDGNGVVMEGITEEFKKIDSYAVLSVSKKYRIMFQPDMHFICIAILDQFIQNLFEHMLFTLGQDPELKQTSVNFNDNCEFHARRKKDGIVFSMRPGMNAKLIIKCDDVTEEQDDDDDDDM